MPETSAPTLPTRDTATSRSHPMTREEFDARLKRYRWQLDQLDTPHPGDKLWRKTKKEQQAFTEKHRVDPDHLPQLPVE